MLTLIGFHKIDVHFAKRLAGAGAHLKPVPNLAFNLLQRLGARRSGDSDGADILARVFHCPMAGLFRNSACEPHDSDNSVLACVVYSGVLDLNNPTVIND